MKQLATVTALAMGLCFSVGANAHDSENRPVPPSFNDIDTNSDQLISREEIQTAMQERGRNRGRHSRPGRDGGDRFDRVDSDGDGYLNKSEFEAARAKMTERRSRHRRHRDCEAADDSA